MSRTDRRSSALTSTISEQLRDAIRDCGLPVRELARESEIDAGMLFRFLAEDRGLTLATVDRLGSYLGLRIVEGLRPKGRPRASGATIEARRRARTRPEPVVEGPPEPGENEGGLTGMV